MKNTVIKCLSALVFTFWFLATGFAQRNFVMVHGLGGGLKSQAPYANLFATRANGTSVTPINFEHNSANGIVAAAADATTKTIGLSSGRPAANRSNDIGIGHSMGGLTVREMDRQAINTNQPKLFGGFIITGPPIHGSRLPTSFQDGSVNNFFHGLCQEVVVDPLLAIYRLNWFSFMLTKLTSWDDDLCDLLFKIVQKSETFKGFQTQSINDFSINANYLDNPTTGINSFTSTTHKVCFQGNENGPVHWRLFSSFINTPNDGTLHSGNHDQTGVVLMNVVEDLELLTGVVASQMAIGCMFDPATWQYVYPCSRIAYELFDGYTWLQQSESQYNTLIGAFGYYQELQEINIFDCYGEREYLESRYRNGQITMIQYWEGVSALYRNPNCSRNVMIPVAIPLNGESDGVVPLKSQRLEGAANFVLDGVNHFELRDHPKVTDQYDLLFSGRLNFNGNLAAQQFFVTP